MPGSCQSKSLNSGVVLTPENDSLGDGMLVTAASKASHVDRDKQLSFLHR